jgi:hypothetical protein
VASTPNIKLIAAALAPHGLILRGGFDFGPGEPAPPGHSGVPAQSVLLFGQAGAASWPHFQRWLEAQPDDLQNPLDTWSRAVIGEVAKEFGARAVGPNEKPYLPFQQWAMRAEGLKASPLGILMHPQYGLWHAYRGALLFEEALENFAAASGGVAGQPAKAPVHLCDLCTSKPCLASCPVGAYSGSGFAYDACVAHAKSRAGDACSDSGCRARNACPHGAAYRYPTEVQAFHMASFIKA